MSISVKAYGQPLELINNIIIINNIYSEECIGLSLASLSLALYAGTSSYVTLL